MHACNWGTWLGNRTHRSAAAPARINTCPLKRTLLILPCRNTVAAQPSVYAGASRLATVPVSLGQPFNCSSPLPLRWMLPAAWQLQVVGVDGAGNKAAPQDAGWTVAFAAGQQYTRFLDGPYGRQPKTNLTFSFAAFDSSGAQLPGPASFECWLEATAGASAGGLDGCAVYF